MLVSISAENFLSFGRKTEFSFSADKSIKTQNIYKKKRVISADKSNPLLKCSLIYGANSAGKSNLVKLFQFVKQVFSDSDFLSSEQYFNNYNRLIEYGLHSPTKITIVLFIQKKYYEYCLSYDDKSIIQESLTKIEKTESLIFKNERGIDLKKYERTGSLFGNKNGFNTYYYDIVLSENPYELILANPINDEAIKSILRYFQNIHIENNYDLKFEGLKELINNKTANFQRKFEELISSANCGIMKPDIKSTPLEKYYSNERDKYDILNVKNEIFKSLNDDYLTFDEQTGDFVYFKRISEELIEAYWIEYLHANNHNEPVRFTKKMESSGTRKFIDLVPLFLSVQNTESLVVIDEVENSMHPVLIKEFLTKFMEQDFKGQILMTTHESHLLDQNIYRQDEINFITNKDFKADIYRLSDFDIRTEINIEKGYLNGRFGAIPFTANIRDLNWDEDVNS